MRAKHIMGPFEVFFEEFETFLILKLSLATLGIILRGQKSLELLKTPHEKAHYLFCLHKKITSRTFIISVAILQVLSKITD